MRLNVFFPISLSLVLAGAAPAAPIAPKSAAAAIEGSWKSACLPIGKNGRHGLIVRVAVTRSKIAATSQTYAHSNCDIPTVRTDYEGRIVARKAAGDTIDFDHVVTSLTMTPNAPDVVAIYNADNSTAGCSMGGGWQLNVPRKMDGRTCAPWTFPKIGTRLYERAWRAPGELRIGSFPAVWTNTTPDKRPTMPGLLFTWNAVED